MKKIKFALVLMCSVFLSPNVAQAEGLLGGVLGGGGLLGGLTGGSEGGLLGDGGLVTLGSGSASSSGLVNLGLLGGDGNLLDVNVGGASSLVDANVSLGGSKGLLDVNAGVGGLLDANVNVGGKNGLIDVGLGLGGDGGGSSMGGGGSGGGGGTGGGGGSGGGGSGDGSGGGGNGGTWLSSGGSSSPSFTAGQSCTGVNPNQLIGLFQSTRLRGWNRATNIQLVPIRVCSDLRRQVSSWLAGNSQYHRMIGAVSSDALINAALSRGNYQPGHVLGVQASGTTLTVYVF